MPAVPGYATEVGIAVGLPRSSADSVLFSTYNVLNLFEDDSAAGREHYGMVVQAIRGLGTDVLAVQEIRGPDGRSARSRLRQLAGDAGMRCRVPGPAGGAGRTALCSTWAARWCGTPLFTPRRSAGDCARTRTSGWSLR